MIKKFLKIITSHKIITGLVIIVLAVGGYYGYKTFAGTKTETRYVLAAAAKETLITSVSGTGQVSASSQVDLSPKASGDVTAVYVKAGQEVKSGALLVQLDTQDAYKTVRDAQATLNNAKLALEKLKQPITALSLTQSENALASAKESKQNYEESLVKAYDDGFTAVANAFLDLPGVITGLNDVLFSNTINKNQWNLDYYYNQITIYNEVAADQYRTGVYSDYQAARAAYDLNFNDYKSISRYADKAAIENLISETYETTKLMADAIKSANNFIQYYQDQLTKKNLTPITESDTHLASLNTYTGTTNSHLSGLLSIKTTIENDKENIVAADRTIKEKTESLAELKAGTDELDLKTQELTVSQKEDALADAKKNLADYSVRASFDGVVATVSVERGDTASTGAAAVTMITKQKIASISLNEVDVAKVKVDQKATLTFDAVSDLSISGEVAEVDALGTNSSGVVSYTVKINFDTQDDRIKSGMSVSATIITETKTDVLMVSTAAIKTVNGGSYVEMPTETVDLATNTSATKGGIVLTAPLKQQAVEIGSSNDTSTEITSGLSEGDIIVVRTISGSSTSSSSISSSTNRSSNQVIFGGDFGGGRPD